MSWQDDVDEIKRQGKLAEQMGGEDSVAFHHSRGKLTVRERLDLLQDEDSLEEIGTLAGSAEWEGDQLKSLKPSNTIIATCKVRGRKVAISGGDFTIRGGSADANVGNKSRFIEQFAIDSRVPYIRLLDATGGSVKTFEQIGRTYLPEGSGAQMGIELMQTVPVVSAVMGSVAGLPAVQACMCHFNLMVKKTSQVFVAGPKVVEEATGQAITKEDLGDERIQVKNGVIMNLAEDEPDAINQIKRFLSYLPQSVYELPPVEDCTDDRDRKDESLVSAIPRNRRQIYDPKKILDAVFDKDSFFEIGPYYGKARVTGLARLGGMPCGVMANNPKFNGGSMDIAAGEKTIRLVEMCETFHLPLIYFADEPGFSVGPMQERAGIVRAGARVVTTIHNSNIPYACIVMRQLYGVAGGLHHREKGFYRRYAWPSTHGGSMHIEGGTAIAYKREIESADDPDATRQEIEGRLQAISSPFRNAHAFGIENMIDPRDTRPLLIEFMEDAWRLLPETLGPQAGLSYRP
jgi:acetyl-CoA carboxylase carboxyltransferase component